MPETKTEKKLSPWQRKIHEIIFEADTPAGKWFDIILILFIPVSLMIRSLKSIMIFYFLLNGCLQFFLRLNTYFVLFRLLSPNYMLSVFMAL